MRILELLDGDKNTLLSLWRMSTRQAMFLKTENLPELLPAGRSEVVPYSPATVHVGGDELRAGVYGLVLGVHGQTPEDARRLIREITRAAVLTRYARRDSWLLPVTRFTRLARRFTAAAQLGGEYAMDFQAALPYWLTSEVERTFASGSLQAIEIGGDVRAALRLEITAGSGAITNPQILSSAGLTTFEGVVPANAVLVIDGSPGVWTVTVNGTNAKANLRGPQPYLDVGSSSLGVTAPGATVRAIWTEGQYE